MNSLFLPLFLFSVVMVSFNNFSLWVSLSSLFLSLFSFLFRFFDEGKVVESSVGGGGGDDDSRPLEEEADGRGATENLEEKGTNEFAFSFRFQTYEEFSKSSKKNFGCEKLDWSGCSSSLSNRYEFLPEKSTSHFVEETEIPSYTVEVLNSCSNHEISGNGDFSVREFSELVLEFEAVDQEITESSADGTEEFSEKILKFEVIEEGKTFPVEVSKSQPIEEEEEEITESFTNGKEESSGKIQREEEEDNDFLRETDFNGSDSDGDIDIGGRFLSDTDFDLDFKIGGYEPDEEINEELEKSPEGNGDEEDSEGLETEWEHQELIEQLKMELKKVRATGLATIFEESESPKIMDELKPWKIDERFQHGDLMEELHKFYRTYRERMRKLDILNYQKMYAMGVLQSKDPLKSFSSTSKSSSPSILSLLSHNLRLYRQKKCQVDPMKDFIREVHCDLEMVYVGQMCLSWEFIQWQYQKALDLWESEPHGLHHYNEVAGEFQQFQVLLQRFLENEAFEGPRVENYVKHRCVVRNLLQVPVIREDKKGDRRKARRGKLEDGYEAITSDMVVEMLQESIRVIWQFIRADKDCHHHSNGSLKRPKKLQVELQDPADEQLLTHIQTDLQKKEKKLKEIMRSGHCILKKLQKNEENEETGGALCFFSEVDMKLVGRVLKMSRITTDQLIWCRNKLGRISFSNRKLHVEPSFFLFPC
ncbi:uncharacterized protein LOC120091420 [Benincasa hispida]|uniref:uncharacterized protein LOC120091420 n=1 Tax=Benincasa hispida TaxID=102211 RepID=UPI0018FFBEEF|nr:uncharacterized protein LOC120091420 [Benincasa hispida]